MNGLSIPIVGRGLPLGNGLSNQGAAQADVDTGDGQQNDVARDASNSTKTNDAGTANDTSASQTVGAANAINAPNRLAQPTTAETADTAERQPKRVQANGVTPPSDQTATRLFFDSLISSMTTGVDIAEIGAATIAPEQGARANANSQPPPDPAATLARNRFLEGLKLVNEPV